LSIIIPNFLFDKGFKNFRVKNGKQKVDFAIGHWMNLIYIDESGNTGLNLKDSQQPVFLLATLILHSE